MSGLYQRWARFWFAPATPANLGICRALFFGGILFYYVYTGWEASAWASVSDVFWMPTTLFQFLQLPRLSAETLQALQWIWIGALALSCVGLLTRVSTSVSFLLGIYLLGLSHNFGKTHHSDMIVVLTMGILAASHCNRAYSIDRLLRRLRRSGHGRLDAVGPSGEHTWPIRLVWVLMTLVYFGAGVSKLRNSGLEWIFSDNLAVALVQQDVPLGRQIARVGWLCQAIAGFTVVCEILAPLALFHRRARAILIPSLFLIQGGIAVLMNVGFKEFMVCYVFWVPWDRVVRLHR